MGRSFFLREEVMEQSDDLPDVERLSLPTTNYITSQRMSTIDMPYVAFNLIFAKNEYRHDSSVMISLSLLSFFF